ncbi:MAG: hypothetical protein H6Q16_1754 [Bacteroidetes bacterium]|nr:hypothetical protein [Bacteroidota bacterium]
MIKTFRSILSYPKKIYRFSNFCLLSINFLSAKLGAKVFKENYMWLKWNKFRVRWDI